MAGRRWRISWDCARGSPHGWKVHISKGARGSTSVGQNRGARVDAYNRVL
jgi:hypothetical protein